MKTTEEIYQSLLAAFAQRAGFTPEADCDLAVRLYAAAAELQALDIQGEWVLDQSFPQTAQGVYLDYHAQMRGIARTAATKAVGTLRFSVERAPSTNLSIAAGTVCMTAERKRGGGDHPDPHRLPGGHHRLHQPGSLHRRQRPGGRREPPQPHPGELSAAA